MRHDACARRIARSAKWERYFILRNASLKDRFEWAPAAPVHLSGKFNSSAKIVRPPGNVQYNMVNQMVWGRDNDTAGQVVFCESPPSERGSAVKQIKGFTYSLRIYAQRGDLTERNKIWRKEEEERLARRGFNTTR